MRKLATTKTPEISGRSLFSPFLLGLQERSEKRGKRPEAATWRSRPRFGAARLSEPRAAGLYRIWSFAGARCASRGCTVHPARILATLVAFASPFGAARLSEPRAADFFVYVILRALGPLLADVQIPPRVRGDWYTQRESNSHLRLRRPAVYPLSYGCG